MVVEQLKLKHSLDEGSIPSISIQYKTFRG